MTQSAKKIIDALENLPEEKKREVLDFAEYLRFRELESAGITTQVVEGLKQVKNRRVRPARDVLDEL